MLVKCTIFATGILIAGFANFSVLNALEEQEEPQHIDLKTQRRQALLLEQQRQQAEIKSRAQLLQIQKALSRNDYALTGALLKETVGKGLTIAQVRKVAKKCNSKSLLRALDATKAIVEDKELNKERIRIHFTRGEFLQIALFIENDLPWHVQRGRQYLCKKQTNLPCDLEYDPQTKKAFIVFNQHPHTYVGAGSNKIVSKAMLYDQKRPKMVARALQTEKKKNEMLVSQALRGSPGVFEIIACTKYEQSGEKYRTIYSKLYKTGSFYDALHKHQFSLYEKAQMALTLIIGVDELHKRKFTHRDISTRNCLIEIPPGLPGKRDIKIGLADLGRSEHIFSGDIDLSKKVQGHSLYNPPEGIFREDIKKKDFLRADVFAMGCVLYELFYGRLPGWHQDKYFRKVGGSESKRYRGLMEKIKSETRKQRNALLAKKASKATTPQEDFEYLILRMVHHNKLKRGNSGELRWEMEQIFNKIRSQK